MVKIGKIRQRYCKDTVTLRQTLDFIGGRVREVCVSQCYCCCCCIIKCDKLILVMLSS